jgi:dTDP-4-dehydrorhamnose reductase
MAKVLILGAHGMLGSMVARVLAQRPELEVSTTARDDPCPPAGRFAPRQFDARSDSLGPLLDADDYEWIVNGIGMLKTRIAEDDRTSIEEAIAVNALFPHRLAAEAAERGQRVIQIATDGVYAGAAGPYDESAAHDPRDVYGKTKSLGETPSENVWHLRCSIVGPELDAPTSLLGWILAAPPGAELTGYDGHRWNGITTLHFAKLCSAIIAGADIPAGVQHVVPGDSVSKAELLELVLRAFGRTDVTVRHTPGPGAPVDRRLATRDPAANERLWQAAGYAQPPTIEAMLSELAAAQAGAPAGAL